VYLQVLRGQRERHKGGRHVGKQWGEPGWCSVNGLGDRN
jgi:hypothetical protein